MKASHAKVRLSDGRVFICYPGDFVGRLEKAEVQIADPRISEAHALFSLRGGGMWLLFLRSAYQGGDGKPAWQLRLEPGLKIALTKDLTLEVLDVDLTAERIALALPGEAPVAVGDAKYGIDSTATPFLTEHGEVVVWNAGSDWQIRTTSGPQRLEPGRTYDVGGTQVEASLLDGPEGVTWTQRTLGVIEVHITVYANNRVRIEDSRGVAWECGGHGATLLWTLARGGGRAGWLDVVNNLWGKDGKNRRDDLRNNVLYRFDKSLRKRGLRDDLVVRQSGTLEFGEGVTFQLADASGLPSLAGDLVEDPERGDP